MIKVVIEKNKAKVKKVTISGHAKFSKKGEDIVCAGVSAISFGILNTLNKVDPENVEINVTENKIAITTLKNTKEIDLILETLIIQLKTVEIDYSKYIQIKGE